MLNLFYIVNQDIATKCYLASNFPHLLFVRYVNIRLDHRFTNEKVVHKINIPILIDRRLTRQR